MSWDTGIAHQLHCNKRQSHDWPIRSMSIHLINLVLRAPKEKVKRVQEGFGRALWSMRHPQSVIYLAQIHLQGLQSFSLTSQPSAGLIDSHSACSGLFPPVLNVLPACLTFPSACFIYLRVKIAIVSHVGKGVCRVEKGKCHVVK